MLAQRFDGQHGGDGVFDLMRSQQRQPEVVLVVGRAQLDLLSLDATAAPLEATGLAGFDETGVALLRNAADDFSDGCVLRGHHHPRARA